MYKRRPRRPPFFKTAKGATVASVALFLFGISPQFVEITNDDVKAASQLSLFLLLIVAFSGLVLGVMEVIRKEQKIFPVFAIVINTSILIFLFNLMSFE